MNNVKRLASLGLAAALVVSSVQTPTMVMAETGKTNDYQKIIDNLDLSKAKTADLKSLKSTKSTASDKIKADKIKKTALFKDDEIVNVVVEVEQDSLVDLFDKSSAKSMKSYLNSNAAINAQTKIKKAVDTVANKVVAEVKADNKKVTIRHKYDTVFTGFSIKVPYGELKKIQNTKGVKNAFVAEKYSIPVEKTSKKGNEPNMITSRDMINSGMVNETGLNGEGMVVAVLDTGLDYKHNAFDAGKLEGKQVRETESTINKAVTDLELDAEKAMKKAFSGSDVYKSAKVPYGFDYADIDLDPIPLHEGNHGTHVSGTIVGNSDQVQGVARDAQVMIFKVFGDGVEGCYDDALIAALDDAVKLNVDAINMSLGSSAGFSTDNNKTLQAVYDSVGEAGINLDVSAGNSYDSAYGNNYANYAPTTMPDAGVVGSPSTNATSLSVASIENTYINNASCFEVGGTKIGYNDSGEDKYAFNKLSGDFEFVDCGKGSPEEVEKAGDLTGKIALISRGDITFSEKVINATENGAKAVIVYNNEPGTISMALEGVTVPAISITQLDGKKMLEALAAGNKTVHCDPELKANFPSATAWQMSDFSSWGPTPSLELKPEITAPGGNIYSAYYVDNGVSVNGNMSGTSMASPHMAGATTLVKEYVKKNLAKFGLDSKDTVGIENMVNTLLMSTSVPVIESEDPIEGDETSITNYYSPRKQGSGIADLNAAVNTPSYITVAGSKRPKAELGYNTKGQYSFEYTIKNTSDKELAYDLTGAVQVEAPAKYSEDTYVAFKQSINITGDGADITFTQNGSKVDSVTVPAKSSVTVKADIKLDLNNDNIKYLQTIYTNGFFVEGFAFASGKDTSAYELSLPFLGFMGDWANLDVFDADIFEVEAGEATPIWSYSENIPASFLRSGNYLLGTNMFNDKSKYSQSHIAISKNSLDGIFTELDSNMFTLRGMSDYTLTYRNSAGKTVKEKSFKNVPKTYYYTSQGIPLAAEDLMESEEEVDPFLHAAEVADGKYTLTISGTPAVKGAKEQTKSYDFVVDSKAPEITLIPFEVDGDAYLFVQAKDNHLLSSIFIGKMQFVVEDDLKSDYAIVKLPNAKVTDLNGIVVEAYDYALNGATDKVKVDEDAATEDTEIEKTVIKSAKNTAANTITLEWKKVADAQSYYVYRSTSKNGKYTLMSSTASTKFTDKKVELGKTYYYKVSSVRAVNNTRLEGGMSDAVAVKSVIPTATSITSIKKTSKTALTIKWKRNSKASGYIIYRSTSKNGKYKAIKTISKNSTTSYKNTVGKKKTYYYKIKVFYKSNGKTYTSAYSKAVKGSTK